MLKGFISYSHDDQDACLELRKHLNPMAVALDIDIYSDHRSRVGQYFDEKYRAAICESSVQIVLLSHNAMWSDVIMRDELPLIAEQERCRNTLRCHVIYDDCAYDLAVGTLIVAPLNHEGRLLPVKKWKDRNSGFDTARQQIQKAICDHFQRKPRVLFSGHAR